MKPAELTRERVMELRECLRDYKTMSSSEWTPAELLALADHWLATHPMCKTCGGTKLVDSGNVSHRLWQPCPSCTPRAGGE